jgi:glycosyltransferase involved in cell wall biosynthesis
MKDVAVQTAGAARLVLLRDGRWPDVSGVCCWRHGVRAAFATTDTRVEEFTWQPLPGGLARAPQSAGQGRLARLPALLRRPVAAAVWRIRQARDRRAAQRTEAARQNQAMVRQLDGADLVVAESIQSALAAVRAGVPRQRVWAFALPVHRLHQEERTGYAAAVAKATKAVGGLLTDSEPARDSLERVATGRPRVEIFPPIAADRPCPAHVSAQPTADLHPAAGLLVRWRRLIDEQGVASRFAADGARSGWGKPAAAAGPIDPQPVGWTADAQLAAARRVWDAATPDSPSPARRRRAVLISGYDLRFARELAERLANRTDLDVTVDEWPHFSRQTKQSEALLGGAESIFADWARHSAVRYSERKRPDQFLAVRLHRYEIEAPYPATIAIDNVDAVVYIAPLMGRRIRDELGWPQEKLVYIPNYVNVDWLDRPKLPEARFALGLVGIEFSIKRFDLALDLLAKVRQVDRRFTLVVRSSQPWGHKFAWARPAERAYTGECFARIEQDPLLRDGVIFDQPGRDMARWFRRIGHVLSTSDVEGCHTAVAEGMASGAVPVVRPWPGAAEVYEPRWVHDDLDAAAEAVTANADPDRWQAQGAEAKAEIRSSYDPAGVVAAWADLLHRDIESARGHFAKYTTGPATPPSLPAQRRPPAWAPQ